MQAAVEQNESGISDVSSHKGKYLTFVLCNEEYGIEIIKVKEIIGIMNITSMPQMPDYMKGVINLRGKIIPIIDLRLKFGFQETEHSKETCIIVIEVNHKVTGVIVDTVSEVLDVNSEELEQAPNLGNGVNTDTILGMAKVKDKVKILLNIDRILAADAIDMPGSLNTVK